MKTRFTLFTFLMLAILCSSFVTHTYEKDILGKWQIAKMKKGDSPEMDAEKLLGEWTITYRADKTYTEMREKEHTGIWKISGKNSLLLKDDLRKDFDPQAEIISLTGEELKIQVDKGMLMTFRKVN